MARWVYFADRLTVAVAVFVIAPNLKADLRSKQNPAQECAVEYARLAPTREPVALVLWTPEGDSKIREITKALNGNLNVDRSTNGRLVFEIDIPRAGGVGTQEIRRVAKLPNGQGAYEFPRLEIRVQLEPAGKEIVLLSGKARGVVEDGIVLLDGDVSHGLGLRIHVPDLDSSAVVIDAGLMSKQNLTDPNSKTTVVPLLDTAMDILQAVAPNRMTILKSRDGSFYRYPGGTTWERVN